ncbi:hypothetical protein [Streptomyces sp. ISL-100]|uniref:hypothetical protein n=1 Tax=Streptomyces sp. ISL-100 TaxID=2819173 RepID=UPI001BE64785|nr:hypothetical protein [Streptomyces sp. ISL-100]MBT2395635.1 hypothetical protein [Streptomyces sp. ISL-100]
MRTTVDNWRDDARSGYPQDPNPNDITVQLDTVRLDGLNGVDGFDSPGGRLPEMPGAPAPQEGSDGPVFVDESGRRSKKLRRIGWVLAFACACYAVTLIVALAGGNSTAPWLQIPGLADDQKKPDTVEISPAPEGSLPPGEAPPLTPGATPVVPADATVLPSADGEPSTEPLPPEPGVTAPKSSLPPKDNRPPPATGGTGPGTNPDPGTDPGTEPDPATDPGTGTDPGTEPDPGTDPGTDPDPDGTDPGTDPDTGTDPGTTDPGAEPADPQTDPAAGGTTSQFAAKGTQ